MADTATQKPDVSKLTREQQALETIKLADESARRYNALKKEATEREQRVQSQIPGVVDRLIEYRRIEPHQKEAAQKALASHEQALELLSKLAAHQPAQTQPEPMGQPAPASATKSASDDGYQYGGRVLRDQAHIPYAQRPQAKLAYDRIVHGRQD